MTTDNNNMMVPKLRFKEFKGEWKNKKIDNIAELTSSKRVYLSDYVSEGIPFYRGKEISELKKNIIPNDILYITESSYFEFKEKYGVPQRNDILITAVGTLGNVLRIQNDDKFYFKDGNLIWFKEITESPEFFEIMLEVKKTDIEKTSIGSTQRALTMVELRKLIFAFPTLPEQQKIASFLSAVDEKIQQLSHKKELLEQYKKGVMQQLFSGTLRFKDVKGKAFPKWEEKLYGDIFSFYSTNSFSRDKLNYESGNVKNIHYGDIHTKFSTLFDIKKEFVPFINDDVDILKIKEENYCQEGDLVIADASEDYADIGKSIELVNLSNEKIVAGLHTFLARPNKVKMHTGFSGYLVKATYVRKQIITIAQGTKVLSLSTGRLSEVKLNIPCLKEQQKIANYLSNIDTKIESVNKQIAQSQSFKKGLLQQLFV